MSDTTSTSDADNFYLRHKKFFDSYRLNREAATRFLQTLVQDPNSGFYTTLQSGASGGKVDSVEAGGKLERRRINVVLTAHQQAVLQAAWGDAYDLEFTQSVKVGHPMPAALRILEGEAILSLCDHSNVIIDVGGNFSHHVRHGRSHVHCCCPQETLRDKARFSTRCTELKMLSSSAAPKVAKLSRDVLNDPTIVTCSNKAERCKVYGKTLVWIHSIYDMDIADIPVQMEAHGAEVGYGVFMYSDAVLDENSGSLPEIDGTFDRVGSSVRFGFRDDPSYHYTHVWSRYVEYLVDRVLNGRDRSYYYRVYPTKRNSMMFTVTALDTEDVVPVQAKSNLILRARRTGVELTVYDVDWTRSSAEPSFVKSSVVVIPPDFYHKALAFCFSKMRDDVADEPLDYAQFLRQCRTYNRYVDIGGRPILGIDKVPNAIFDKVVTSLFHLGAMITAYRRVRTGIVLRDLQSKRTLATTGVMRNILRYGRTFLPSARVFRALVDDFRLMLLDTVNKDLHYVMAEEEKKFRLLQTVSVVSTMSTTPLDTKHVLERDIQDQWKVDGDDLSLVADLLDAEGSGGLAEKVRSFSLTGSGDTTAVQSESGGEDETDRAESVETDSNPFVVSLEEKMKATGLDHDPTDREAADTYRRAAIDEFVGYCRKSHEKDLGSVASQALESWSNAPDKFYCQRKMNTVESPNYLKFANGVMVESAVPVTNDSYMWGFDPCKKELHKIVGSLKREMGGQLKCYFTGWLFVSSELVVLNSHLIADSIEQHVSRHGYGPHPIVRLSEGVAGSGKSTRIRDAHQPKDMILTATRGCMLDMRRRVRELNDVPGRPYKMSDAMIDAYIKTMDSFTIGSSQTADVLRIDEALLVHFGAAAAAAMMCRCKLLYLSGDKVQIPFLNRIESIFKLKYAKLQYYDHYEIWTRSFRLTQDAMKAANHYYYKGLGRTSNPVKQGIVMTKIVDTSDPIVAQLADKADLCMGFYKAERAELKKRTKCKDVRTVHESQGEDMPSTLLVRFNDKDVGGLYSGPAEGGPGHVLVGFTRHNKRLHLLHKGPDDFLMEFYRRSQEPMNKDSYLFDEEVHEQVKVFF